MQQVLEEVLRRPPCDSLIQRSGSVKRLLARGVLRSPRSSRSANSIWVGRFLAASASTASAEVVCAGREEDGETSRRALTTGGNFYFPSGPLNRDHHGFETARGPFEVAVVARSAPLVRRRRVWPP